MPAKPGKDFITHNFVKLLTHLHSGLPQPLKKYDSAEERATSPPTKRQKLSQGQSHFTPQVEPTLIKDLHANKLLFIGLNQVQKVLLTVHLDPTEKPKYLVLMLNDPETADINKHLIGFCRQFGFHNFLFPKFLKKNICDIFGVKRLTSFALKVEDEALR